MKKFHRYEGTNGGFYYFAAEDVMALAAESLIHPGYFLIRLDGEWIYVAKADYLALKERLGIS